MRDVYYHILGDGVASMLDSVPLDGPRDRMITRLSVPPDHRGCRRASALLDEFLADADREGLTIWLMPQASEGHSALTQAQLEAFYRRRGFEPTPTGIWRRRPHGRS